MKKSFILQQNEISFVKNTFTQYLIDKLGVIEVQGPILSQVGNGMQDNLSGIEKAVQVNVKCIPGATFESYARTFWFSRRRRFVCAYESPSSR